MLKTGLIWLLAIELGEITIRSATPLEDVLWVIIGLLLLTTALATLFWWNNRSQPDPFL